VEAREQLGANVRRLRLAAGMTQEQLSYRAKLHLTEISRIENGRRDPQLATIVKVADALRIAPAELLAGIGVLADGR
jgi:transcriptional regulator with XRE-family HTH domain